MNFFEQQDQARRNTRLLVLLFLIAVAALILLTNGLVAAFLYFSQDYNVYVGSRGDPGGFWAYFSWPRFGLIGLGITLTVGMVVLVRWLQLRGGGKAVAEGMGGERIVPQTDDKAERRCLNVVAEMALAANMPVPPVYVMNGERGINAFAAGTTLPDAVVAVTRGTINHLKRQELQGVIAHEFSHILNGDMRLNVRLAALLKGITFVGDVGHILLRSSNRHRTGVGHASSSGGPALPILGLALWILGWLGGLAAGFIKAAIGRQKEFLADASAVQFTRSNEGIGDALKVIGGYVPGTLVHAARAHEMSHIFFGEIEHGLWQLFATHPPLDERIRRVQPDWDGSYIERKIEHYAERPTDYSEAMAGVGRAAIVAAATAAAAAAMEEPVPLSDEDFGPPPEALEQATAERYELPVAFVRMASEPLGASALVLALLLSADEATHEKQMQAVIGAQIDGLDDMVATVREGVAELVAGQRLPLLELCLPALKSTSYRQYRNFKDAMLKLVQADARVELYEWCFFQLMRHYLDPEFIQVKPSKPRYNKLTKLRYHLRVVLSVLAHEGGGDAHAAFDAGVAELELTGLVLMPRDQASVAAFSKGVHELRDCYPLLKPRVLKAMAAAAAADGEIQPTEREVVLSIAAVMDCPLPEGFLGGLKDGALS
ncbi:MAG: M48 family metallopeptidase [Pseudomonadota bacterium]